MPQYSDESAKRFFEALDAAHDRIPRDVQDALESQGFEFWHTGGGLTAYAKMIDGEAYRIMLTTADNEAPTDLDDGNCMLGADDIEGTALYHIAPCSPRQILEQLPDIERKTREISEAGQFELRFDSLPALLSGQDSYSSYLDEIAHSLRVNGGYLEPQGDRADEALELIEHHCKTVAMWHQQGIDVNDAACRLMERDFLGKGLLAFDEFQSSREWVESVRDDAADPDGNAATVQGYCYLGTAERARHDGVGAALFIQYLPDVGKYLLLIGNAEYQDADIASLEWKLYTFAAQEGWAE